jgi:hypothetical protein
MNLTSDPFRLHLISLAGWMNQQEQDVNDYLQEENRVLHDRVYHFSPLGNLTRQRELGYADTHAKKGPPLSTGPADEKFAMLHSSAQNWPYRLGLSVGQRFEVEKSKVLSHYFAITIYRDCY